MMVNDPPARWYRHARLAMTGSAVAAIGWAGAAQAQSASFNPKAGRSGLFERRLEVAVGQRPQPQFDALPIRLASFDLLATAGARIGYVDNIYATRTNRVNDVLVTTSASAVVTSDWSRHEISAFARGDLVRYIDNGSQNLDLYTVGARGRVDVDTGSSIQAGGQFGRNVVSRLSTRSTVVTARQITYDEIRGFVGGTYGARQLRIVGQAEIRDQNYARSVAIDQGGFADFADRRLVSGYGRVEYAPSAAVYGLVEVSGNDRSYRNEPATVPTRNSSGYEITTGANFELGVLARGEVAIGYLQQKYTSSAYRDFDGLAYHAQLEYFPTQLVTMTFNADREIDDAAQIGLGAFVANTFSLKADYELLRNLLITPQVGYGTDSYPGLDLDFHRYFARAEARYTFNRALVASVRYAYDQRTSNDTAFARAFKVNQLSAAFTYRF